MRVRENTDYDYAQALMRLARNTLPQTQGSMAYTLSRKKSNGAVGRSAPHSTVLNYKPVQLSFAFWDSFGQFGF